MCTEKLILPFDINPLAICYHYIAFPLGIIQANANNTKEDITPWIIGRYINCLFDESSPSNKYKMCVLDGWAKDDEILARQFINMFKHTYGFSEEDLINFLKKFLKSGCYVSGGYNEKYIPGKAAYQKRDFLHDYIIYGFDDEREIFYSAGFMKDRKYEPFEIPYHNFAMSLFDSPSDRMWFEFYQYNAQASFQLNLNRITNELRDYIHSTISHDSGPNCCYGMAANKRLREYFVMGVEYDENPQIDMRYSRGFMEHKYFLHLCVRFLCENHIIRLSDGELEQLKEVYQKAILAHRIGMKLTLSKNRGLINTISDIFDWIEKTENEILPKVLATLEGIQS